MPELQERFEQIARMGQEELALIATQDVQALDQAVTRRERALQEFIDAGNKGQEDAFLDKLLQLKAMHASLQGEVRALHQSLKEELLKLRSENRRMGGYRNGGVVIPLTNRLISRRG